MMGRIENPAVGVAREVCVPLTGVGKILGIQLCVAGIDRVGDARGREEELTERCETHLRVTQEIAALPCITDDRKHELTDDHVKRLCIDLGWAIGCHVGLVKPQQFTRRIGGDGQLPCGTNCCRTHIDPSDRETPFIKPFGQSAIAAADVQ